ncbi:MAG TPA: glycoside hydrolase family 140 protein [Bacteroidales bacterium]|nr:glycoside hydrolase family 140 protein [Bacteroidales bacterium]
MKPRFFLLLVLVFLFTDCRKSTQHEKPFLMVSPNGRYLMHSDGKPFLWIGDTGWELFHRLNREEADYYLSMRAKQGYSVIQAVVLAEMDGLNTPNAYGEKPLIENDPMRPNEAYFRHVDYVVDKAEELGLFIGMLPTWGDKVPNANPGYGPVVFTKQNAFAYGEFLGKRYRDKLVIWILGGDRNVDSFEALDIWRAMADGLRKGDNGRHLITYHPRGEASSHYWLHNESWLDMNGYQSGHARHFNKVYRYAEALSLLQPRKPFIDLEPAYEDIPVRFWDYWNWYNPKLKPEEQAVINGFIVKKDFWKEGFFTDYDVRVHAYWDFLSGACGYTYGNNAIWQMFREGINPAIPCLTNWKDALERPGAASITHLRKILEARPFHKLIPDQSVIYGFNNDDSTHVRAAVSEDKDFLLVYLALGQKVSLTMGKVKAKNVNVAWYNPAEGRLVTAQAVENTGIKEFVPPSSGKGNDWLLILEDPQAGLPPVN